MNDQPRIARLGGRKFLACLAALLGMHVALACSLITALIYRDLMIGIVGAYILGNVVQKATAKAPADPAKPS